MNRKFLLIALTFVCAMTISAQEAEETEHAMAPYNFIGVQAGVQNTFNKEFNNWKTFTPTASLSFGRYFNPVLGVRLHVNGIWDKSGVNYLLKEDGHYKYNYLTGNIDALVNLCTLFGKKDWYPVNVFFVGGLGANYIFENYYRSEEKALGSDMYYADNDHRLAFNGRVGLGIDIPICKLLSFNIEADYNARFGRAEKFNADISQITLQAGLNFRFGYGRKEKADAPVVVSSVDEYTDSREAETVPAEIQYRTRIDTIWYDDVTYKEVPAEQNIERNIFYEVRESDVDDSNAEIKAIANFVKNNKNCKVIVTGYADKDTGNPSINMRYSRERANKATKALVSAGVNEKSITTIAKGDTVQPQSENDKNRLVIIAASGNGTKQEKVTTKKFRTKEVKEAVR